MIFWARFHDAFFASGSEYGCWPRRVASGHTTIDAFTCRDTTIKYADFRYFTFTLLLSASLFEARRRRRTLTIPFKEGRA